MKVQINGKIKEVKKGITLLELIKSFNLDPERLVIEYNGNILNKNDLDSIILKEKDRVELIQFVGGG